MPRGGLFLRKRQDQRRTAEDFSGTWIQPVIPHYPGYSSSLISLIRILVYNDSRGAIQKLNEKGQVYSKGPWPFSETVRFPMAS
jgi:hypothetical protein